MFVLLLNMMNNSNRSKASNRGVARGTSISGHGSNEEGECHCKFCFLRKHFGPQPIRFELSNDDFVENPYRYGLNKKKDEEHTDSDDDFVPCTYTSKASTSSGLKGNKSAANKPAKTRASTSSVVTDSNLSNSDDDFVPCTFKADCNK